LGRATWEACSGNLEEKWEPSQHLHLGPRKTKKTSVEDPGKPRKPVSRTQENQENLCRQENL